MKSIPKMSTDELVGRFIDIGIAQGVAVETFNSTRVNRLFDQKVKVANELRRRPGDQRSHLLPLYDHENFQVRLNAIQSTYALDPARANRVLSTVAASGQEPWAGNARLSLSLLEMGVSQLPDDPWIPETRKERLALHEAMQKQARTGVNE